MNFGNVTESNRIFISPMLKLLISKPNNNNKKPLGSASPRKKNFNILNNDFGSRKNDL